MYLPPAALRKLPSLRTLLSVVVEPRDALGEAHGAIRLGVPRDPLLRVPGVSGVVERCIVLGLARRVYVP